MVWANRVAFALVLVVGLVKTGVSQSSLRAESGVLDARHWNFEKRLPLSGYWVFHEGKLMLPGQADTLQGITQFFPAIWNEGDGDKQRTEYGTYVLRVLLPDSVQKLGLEIPQLYNSYILWVNGMKVASSGVVGKTVETTHPKWVHQTVTFPHAEDTLVFVLQIANFHHHKGGSKAPILLGSAEGITKHLSRSVTINVIEAFILLLAGITFLAIYFTKKKRVILYFAMLSLTWAVRCLFSNLYPVVVFFPDIDWQLLVKTEYLTLYFAVLWAILFLHHLLDRLSHAALTYIIVTLNILFILYTLFTPVVMFSQWLSLYLAVAGIVVLYGGYLIVRALLAEHAGSWFLMGSILTGVIIFGYDILAYNTTFNYNYIFLSTGYLVIFLLTAMALLFHLGILKSKFQNKDVLTYEDFFQKSGK
jgi:hypothetical protein